MHRASMTRGKCRCAFIRRDETFFRQTGGASCLAFSSTDSYQTGLYSTTCVLVYSNFSIGPLQSGLSIALLMTLSSPTADTVTFLGARLDLTYPHILDTPFPPGLLSSLTFNDTNAWAGLLALQEYKTCSRRTIQTRKIPHFSAMF